MTFASCGSSGDVDYKIENDKGYLIITPDDTKGDLMRVVKKFKNELDVDIDLSKSTYREGNTIDVLNIRVFTSKSSSTTAASPFTYAIGIIVRDGTASIHSPEEVTNMYE